MNTAKIVRIRHREERYKNDELTQIDIEDEFKIVFSHPDEMKVFKEWVVTQGGKYDFDKKSGHHMGEIPPMKDFFGDEDFCWCDIMTYALVHVMGYSFHSALFPYKGEVYVKAEEIKDAEGQGK